MNVHLVWNEPQGDHIIDRLMRLLSENTGWSLSDRPDAGADLNHFGVYIDYAQRFSDWHKTPTACYFSHLEPDVPYKRFWWEQAAHLIDHQAGLARRDGSKAQHGA